MDEKRIREYAKYFLYDEIAKIENIIDSGNLSTEEEMILSEKMMQ